MIAALPELVERHPDLTYVILGATHPHLIAREGEAYREELEARVRELGLGEHVCFVNDYVDAPTLRSEEHTSELQSLMRISYAVFCLKKKKQNTSQNKYKPQHTN